MLGLELGICQGYTGFCINFILRIQGVLNVFRSELAKVLNVSEV